MKSAKLKKDALEASRRSREGAWIEMPPAYQAGRRRAGRSREGAWIEIVNDMANVILRSGRSREGAWIEMVMIWKKKGCQMVAPVRERGLK